MKQITLKVEQLRVKQEEQKTPKKDLLRTETIEFLYQHFITKLGLTTLNVLNLPGAYWFFERELRTRLEGVATPKFVACEYNRDMFKRAQTFLTYLFKNELHYKDSVEFNCPMVTDHDEIMYLYLDVFKYISKLKNSTLDIIWLDLMCQVISLDKEQLKPLQIVTKPGSIVMITLRRGREKKPIPYGNRRVYVNRLMKPLGFELLREDWYNDGIAQMMQLMYLKQ